MAGGSNLIQVPDADARLRRLFNIQNTQIAPVVAPEIVPVVIVADVSNTAPAGTAVQVREFYARGLIVGPNQPYVQFFNPEDSNHYMRILSWWVRSTVADVVDIIKVNTRFDASPSGGVAFFEDFEAEGVPMIEIATGTTAAPLSTSNTLFAVDVGASASNFSTVQYETQILLKPGTGLVCQRVAATGALEIAIRGRQRAKVA